MWTEPISLTALFGASKGVVDISIKLAKSLKLIASIESKLDLLMQVEFNAAWKTLIQACNSSASKQQRDILINDARNGFTKGTLIEKGERLFYAHLGLGICHYLLDDINNVKTAFLEATKISIYKDIYLQERDSYWGFNKYGIDSIKNTYNLENMLNTVKSIFTYPLLLKYKAELKKYNQSNKKLKDISSKINAEEQMIIMVTKMYKPSNTFKTLESKSLEFIRLQKECLDIIVNS